MLWEIAETTKGFQIIDKNEYNIMKNRWETRAPDTRKGKSEGQTRGP